MPLLPIDLQTMFSHLNRIGKDQATLKNSEIENQAAQAQEIVKETEKKDNTVNETKDVGDGLEKVKDEEKKNASRKEKKKKKNDEEENEEKKEVLKDPDLGHHIDISG